MSGIMKGIGILVIIFVVFAIWKYGFGDESTSAPGGSDLTSVMDKDWVKGEATAPATLMEYTDFQCPACGAYYPMVKQVLEEMPGKVKLVIRHYPLIQIHPNALPGARMVEAAGRQGKFWEMYDILFVNQSEWSKAADPMKSIFPAYAGRAGMDVEQFKKDMADSSLDDKINADRESGNKLKINGTPSFFLNGKPLANPKNVEELKKAIEKAEGQ